MNAFGPLPLPTDNLYKFYALTGVAIVFFAFYATGRLSDDLIRRVNAQTLAVEKAEIERDYLKNLIDRLNKIVDDAKANLSDEDAHKQGKIPLHISEQDLGKLIDRAGELTRDFSLKMAELNSATREITQAQRYLTFVRIIGLVFSVAGALLAQYGFKKWSVIQEMQDKALERQFAELQPKSREQPSS